MKRLLLLPILLIATSCTVAAPVISSPEPKVNVNDLSTFSSAEKLNLAQKFTAFDYKSSMIIVVAPIVTDTPEDANKANEMKRIAARNLSGYAQMFYPALIQVVLDEGYCIPTNVYFEKLIKQKQRVAYETGLMTTLFNVAVDARIRIFGLEETMNKTETATPATLMLEGLNILQKYECNPTKAQTYMGEEESI